MPELEQINLELGVLQEELNKLKTYSAEISTAKEAAVRSVDVANKIITSLDPLLKSSSELVNKIEKIDFPAHFHSLETVIDVIKSDVQKISELTSQISKNTDDLPSKLEKLDKSILSNLTDIERSLEDKINKHFQEQTKKTKMLNTYLILTLVIVLAILILLIVKLQ